jgi:hypothetical protein
MKYIFLLFLCLSAKILLAQNIIFRTSVENLRLREQPNLESKVIKTVPKGTRLQWSGIRSDRKVSADWKGAKVADYWYKVKTNQDSIAWVFGKSISFDGLIGDENVQNIDNEWIRQEKSNEVAFNKIPIIKVLWKSNLQNKSKEDIHENFTLKYDNDEFGVDYEGDILGLGYYF